eukprot:scaffold14_cov130-Cylindrotheca_fusiformis.AAC.3
MHCRHGCARNDLGRGHNNSIAKNSNGVDLVDFVGHSYGSTSDPFLVETVADERKEHLSSSLQTIVRASTTLATWIYHSVYPGHCSEELKETKKKTKTFQIQNTKYLWNPKHGLRNDLSIFPLSSLEGAEEGTVGETTTFLPSIE